MNTKVGVEQGSHRRRPGLTGPQILPTYSLGAFIMT
jgi:hypothetical protein